MSQEPPSDNPPPSPDEGYDLQPETPPAEPSPRRHVPASGPETAKKLKPEPKPPTEEELDAQQHQADAILAYICFLIPLLRAPRSPFARYHANQALVLFLSGLCLMFPLLILELLRPYMERLTVLRICAAPCCIPSQILVIFLYTLAAAQGIVHATNGEKAELPLIGRIQVLKD